LLIANYSFGGAGESKKIIGGFRLAGCKRPFSQENFVSQVASDYFLKKISSRRLQVIIFSRKSCLAGGSENPFIILQPPATIAVSQRLSPISRGETRWRPNY
jgi:hypothetical protein